MYGVIVFGVVCAGGLASVRADESPETRTVKEQLARQSARIESLEVSYKLETRSDLKPEELLAIPAFLNQIFLPKDEWREAFKGTKRYVRQTQPERVELLTPSDAYGLFPPREPGPTASQAMRESWQRRKQQHERSIANIKAREARGIQIPKRDPSKRELHEREDVRAFNGHTMWRRRPRSIEVAEYTVWPIDKSAHWFSISSYQAAVGIQAVDSTPGGREDAKGLEQFRIADWVKTRDYQVEGRTEVVDGSTCVLLKGTIQPSDPALSQAGATEDRIWLDRDHGFVARKREMTKRGKLRWRWTTFDLKEIEPGLWLPYRTLYEQFEEEAPPAFQGKPVLVEETRVQKLEINHVPDDLFDMVPRKGDQITDMRGSP